MKKQKRAEAAAKPVFRQTDLLIVFVLIVATFFVYADVGSFDFNSYDDNLYVTENPQVQAGLTAASIKWALTAVVASNWMPVTLLSHMLDCQLFHLQSGMHHLMNVLLHMLATLLLFASLKRATAARWPSAFVAAVFAVHPLHVESVAWVAERKDVLSAFFCFLALYGYVRYCERPNPRAYALMALAFSLGLMAKPMLVTFPFVLLLLDVWPLGRWQMPKVIWEKAPLVAIAAAVSAVTFWAQSATQAVHTHPLPVRIENAAIAYGVYLLQTIWPSGLAALYPYQESPALWQAVLSLLVVGGITAGVIRWRRSRPYLLTGWFWYLGTLVPVIGLVQVGLQSHADRYMYIPMVGLLLMIAWGAAELVERRPQLRMAVAGVGIAACVACLAAARGQTSYWQNSGTLFERALDVTRENYVAEYNLGNYLMNTHRSADAVPHFQAALRIHPSYAEAENNLGMILGTSPETIPEAISHFEAALRINPNLVQAHYNLALLLKRVGRSSEALEHYQAVERLRGERK